MTARPSRRTPLGRRARRAARRVAADLPAYLADLERLVNIDCGSYTPAGVNEVGRWVAAFLAELGATVERGPIRTAGSATRSSARSTAGPGGPRVLLIGHMDTVFDPGTAAERPFRIEDGIAYGPGVTDMKSGLLAGLYAIRAIVAERGGLPFERLIFIANPDEEIGSPTSTPHIARLPPTTPTSRSCSSARAPTATSSRRARASSTCASSSTAAPRTPASSPRRAAARSSRRPGSSASSTPSTAAGRP